MKSAFTIIELVFVVVILGILAAVAIPRLGSTAKLAKIGAARAEISSIRAGIMTERQGRLITGVNTYITDANLDSGNGDYFGGVLTYGIKASTGDTGWSGTAGSGTYTFKIAGSSNTFNYYDVNGTFLCTAGNECAELVD